MISPTCVQAKLCCGIEPLHPSLMIRPVSNNDSRGRARCVTPRIAPPSWSRTPSRGDWRPSSWLDRKPASKASLRSMVALKSSEFESFLARGKQAIALIFGPDSGLVRERAQALIGRAVDNPDDPFALARIEGDSLADTPDRLVEEAHTIPLFGGRRAVWVRSGG